MKKEYFGTDGIRGRIGNKPMTPDFILKLGWAVGKVLADDNKTHVMIGKDTRISGYMLESALQSGLVAAGVDIHLLGPMPTPAVAYFTRTFRAAAGIVVSASHNPYYDNGVKFFTSEGVKPSDEIELKIEEYLKKEMVCVSSEKLGKVMRIEDAAGRYIEFCKRSIASSISLEGLRIVVDCANGATYHISPSVFSELGADVIPIHVNPDGVNINHKCGATSLNSLAEHVDKYRADLGIALDGDGDRLMMIDHKGESVDGDEILAIIAKHLVNVDDMKGVVVGTLMSNLGLEKAIKSMGLGFVRANVGDRYVMDMLNKHNGILGGESSGHIIVRDRLETGDGTIAALQVLSEIVTTGKTLHELKRVMKKYPQTLINVPLSKKFDLSKSQPINKVVSEVEKRLDDRGRVLLRSSGTEPLIRVMVEGQDSTETQSMANEIADTVSAVSA